jgi:hypothetical protein
MNLSIVLALGKMIEYISYDDDLFLQVKEIWPSCEGIRKSSHGYEFALDSTYGLQWFPVFQSPGKVEKLIQAYGKLND